MKIFLHILLYFWMFYGYVMWYSYKGRPRYKVIDDLQWVSDNLQILINKNRFSLNIDRLSISLVLTEKKVDSWSQQIKSLMVFRLPGWLIYYISSGILSYYYFQAMTKFELEMREYGLFPDYMKLIIPQSTIYIT